MHDVVKPTIVLFVICTIITLALAFTNLMTKDRIDEMIKTKQEDDRRRVLSLAESFEEVAELEEIVSGNEDLNIVKEAYRGIKGEETVGNVFLVESKGYGGPITITVGIDVEGKITGVEIGTTARLPAWGLKQDEPFISQFVGIIPQEPLKVVKTIRPRVKR